MPTTHKVKLTLPMSTMTPLVDAGTGTPGTSLVKSCEDHQHPEAPVRPTPVVSSTLYVTGDYAGGSTIVPPAGEGASLSNSGTFETLCPPTRQYIQTWYEQSSVSYYIQADGSLGATPPVTSGELTATVPATIQVQSAAVNLTSWPGGTIPITLWAWVTGGSGSYTFGFPGGGETFNFDRAFSGGSGTRYAPLGTLPARQSITGTPTLFTFNVPVDAAGSTNLTDMLVMQLGAAGNSGATLHIAYGGAMPGTVGTLFPPSGADYWAGMAKLPIISLAGVPGLLTWVGGALGFVLEAEVDGGIAGQSYGVAVQVLRVTGSSSSVLYQGAEGIVGPDHNTFLVNGSPQRWFFAVPVSMLSGVSTDQLAVIFLGTSNPGGVPSPGTVLFKLYYGGPDPALATQVQTLFGAPGGGGGISGRIHTPDVTVSIVSNTVTMGNSNSATVTAGTGPVYGVAIAGWNAGDVIWIRFAIACTVTDGGSPGTGFAPFAMMTGGLGSPEDAVLTAGSILGFRLRGDLSAWDEIAAPAVK